MCTSTPFIRPWITLIVLAFAVLGFNPAVHAAADPEEGEPGEHDGFIDKVFTAFKAEDYARIETFRSKLDEERVDEVLTHWKAGLAWDVKNGFVHLLIHREGPDVEAIMRDALKSKRLEARAAAVVTLNKQSGWGDLAGADGKLVKAKVAAAVAELKKK
jgi:hypothetical protein